MYCLRHLTSSEPLHDTCPGMKIRPFTLILRLDEFDRLKKPSSADNLVKNDKNIPQRITSRKLRTRPRIDDLNSLFGAFCIQYTELQEIGG